MDTRPLTSDTAGCFRQRGYAVVSGLIAPERAATLRAHLEKRAAAGTMRSGDDHVPGTPFVYGDLHADALMQDLLPELERRLGLLLYPTYSYARIYKHGDALYPHRDRAACEISVSLNLGQTPDTPWALHIGEEGDSFAALLRPGDALLYRGTELTHWREPFAGDNMAQAFLHYVDRNGPHAGEKFDGRDRLGNAFQSQWRPITGA
jgi:hypothetical protein